MRVLGIDPGSRLTGWGVVELAGTGFRHVESGTLTLPAVGGLGRRLAYLHAECGRLIARFVPAVVVLERAFLARNVQSAFRLGEARGAVLAAVAGAGVILHEYTPAEVKLATVGYGRADKDAMIRGVALRLGLAAPPRSDAADALALALCHLHRAPLLARVTRALARDDGAAPPARMARPARRTAPEGPA